MSSTEVVYMSREHANTVFIVERKTKTVSRAPDGTPIVEPVGDDKVAEFRGGLCTTSDPAVIKFLDNHEGIWRADDPLANHRFNLGDENVAAIEAAVLARAAERN